MIRNLSSLPIMLVLASCGFEESVPKDAQIVCALDTDCPTDMKCIGALGRCVSSDAIDGTPPALEGTPALTPRMAKVGTEVTLTLQVTEALAQPPDASVDVGTRRAPFSAGDRDGRTYTMRYVVDGSEEQGTRTVAVSLVDMSGNEVAGLAAGEITFDFVAPRLTTATLSRSAVQLGDSVVLALELSEAVESLTVALRSVLSDGPGDTLEDTSFAAGDSSAAVTVVADPATLDEGEYELLVTAVDEAGNSSAAIPAGRFFVDYGAPQVLSSSVLPERVRPGDAARVIVTLSEPVVGEPQLSGVLDTPDGAVISAFSLDDASGSQIAFEIVMEATAADGARALVLDDLADAAGNVAATATLDKTLTVDGSPPALVDFAANALTVTASDTLVVSFLTDEPLEGEPAVSLGAFSFTRTDDGTGPYEFELVLAGTALVGSYPIEVRVLDAVGNVGLHNPALVSIDAAAPVLIDAVFTPAVARFGVTAALNLVVNEELSAPPTLSFDGIDPGFTFLSHAGLSWTFILPITEAVDAGSYALNGVTLTDLVGNVTQAPLDPLVVRFDVDATAPEIVSLTLASARVGPSDTVVATVTLSESNVVLDARAGNIALGCNETGLVRTCQGPQDELPEGAVPILVTATDGAGNTGFASEILVVDRTAPQVVPGSVSLTITAPAETRGLVTPTRARAGATVRVSFTVDEPLAVSPILSAPELTFVVVSQVGASYVLEGVVPLSAVNDTSDIDVQLEDDVANVDTQPLGVTLTIDVTRPPSLADSAMTLIRFPWGAEETGGDKRVYLEAAQPDPYIEARATLVVWDEPDLNEALVIGRAQATNSGGFDELIELTRADRPRVWVTVVDEAGNFDADQPRLLKETMWVATLGDKTPGNITTNPHRLRVETARHTALWPRDELVDEQAGGAVALPGGAALSTNGGGRFTPRVSTSTTAPSVIESESGFAYDPIRGEMVLVGGDIDNITRQTWTRNSSTSTWVQHNPPVAPPYTWIDALVQTPGGFLAAWSGLNAFRWDGVAGTWVALPAAWDLPFQGGGAPRMVFDTERNRIVGVTDSTFGTFSGTWEHDGTSWTQVGGDPTPGRYNAVLGFDEANGSVVMFGGYDNNYAPLNDTLVWNGAAWVTVSIPVGSRPPAGEGKLGFDPASQQLLFAASAGSTWAFTGTTWTNLGAVGALCYGACRLAPDPSRGRLLAYSDSYGAAGSQLREWIAEENAWRRIDPPSTARPAGAFVRIVTDEARGRVVAVADDGTWLWDDERWTRATTATPLWAAIAFDSARGRVVALGAGSNYNEVWEWSGSAWTSRGPSAGPDASAGAAAYDPDQDRVVLFGGCAGGGPSDGTWEWNPVTNVWTNLAPSVSPNADCDVQMVWDDALHRVVLSRATAWSYDRDNNTWEPLPSPGVQNSILAYDPARRATFSFGGGSNTAPYGSDETWELRNSAWAPVTKNRTPGTLPFWASMTAVPWRDELLIFGPFIADASSNATWSWSAAREAPAHVMHVATSPLDGAGVTMMAFTGRAGATGTATDGSLVHGVSVEAFIGRGWQTLGTNDAAATSPGFFWVEAPEVLLAAATRGDEISIRLTPRAPSGAGTARVVTDYIETRVWAAWP